MAVEYEKFDNHGFLPKETVIILQLYRYQLLTSCLQFIQIIQNDEIFDICKKFEKLEATKANGRFSAQEINIHLNHRCKKPGQYVYVSLIFTYVLITISLFHFI